MFHLNNINLSSLYLTENILGMNKTTIQNKNNSKNNTIMNDASKRKTNLIKMIKHKQFLNDLNILL